MRRLRDMAAAATVAALLAGWFTTTVRGQDLTTALSQFLSNLSAGNLVVVQGTNASMLKLGGTTSAFPALKRNGANINVRAADDSVNASLSALSMGIGTTSMPGTGFIQFTGGLRDGTSGNLLVSETAPTISSGFGTTPSIANNNGSTAFTVNVGTGGAATSGVIGLPAAATGWNCFANDLTTTSATVFLTKQTATTTTTATLGNFNTSGVAAAWAASDILSVSCLGF